MNIRVYWPSAEVIPSGGFEGGVGIADNNQKKKKIPWAGTM
jgi:hypothetical protein